MNKEYVCNIAQELLNIDSPSGYTKKAMDFVEQEVRQMGYQSKRNPKGNLFVYVDGKQHEKTIGLCAHCDTLGLMVRSIKANGYLAITTIGGPILPTLDGEYCTIHTRDGREYTGTILSTTPAAHVYPEASKTPRTMEHLEVRIDEVVSSKEDVEKLGIQNGDFIAYDSKVQLTKSGYIKSRFLDDKISVSALLGVLQHMSTHHITPENNSIFMISCYEEVGHGMSWIPQEISEVLAVDMGCIGLDLACSEHDVSICAKDSSGPYDYELTSRLIELAKQHNLPYAIDIYPQYGSDVSAALRGGQNIRGALIGPGVHASHGMERTHYDGVEATMKLVLAYICDEAKS